MIKSFRGKTPVIAVSAFVSETALVMGDVVIGEHSGVWPGAIIRGDFGRIIVGEGTILEDNVVVHTGGVLTIGNNVIVGHGAVIHCKSIGNSCLIANNSTILDDAVLGDYCVVAAGCVVSPRSEIPSRSLVMGVPGRITGEVKDHQMARLERGNSGYIAMFEEYRKAGL